MFSVLILIALVLCLATALTSAPAAAQRRHHHHRHHFHAQQHQVAAKPVGFLAAFRGGSLLDRAREDIGKGCRQLGVPCRVWCADWMNRVVGSAGLRGTGFRAAKSFSYWGEPLPPTKVGAVVVLNRRGGGHVGLVEGLDANDNVIAISGNHAGTVRKGLYPKYLVVAYRVS